MIVTDLFFKLFASFITFGKVEVRFTLQPHQSKIYQAIGSQDGPSVILELRDPAILRRITLNPQLAIPEAYMDGQLTLIDTSLDAFIIFLFHNKQQYDERPVGRLLHALATLFQCFHSKIPKAKAKRNVAHHYDLSSELYELFLDKRKQYSCAYFETETDTLDQAQIQKIARLGAKLRLKDNASVLDIGCGWGELAYALTALKKNISVHGITLSENQLAYAKTHVTSRKDRPQVQFSLQDYRDETGLYDHIVSVGMLEHVGKNSYGRFFDIVSQCLKEDGCAVIHTIGKRRACPTTTPFITKYIFPGGYIPTLADLSHELAKRDLHIADIEAMHNHYALTLRHWKERCREAKQMLISLNDERFYRMWQFYLTSCEYFFRLDEGVVYQIQLIKKRDDTPSTRGYILTKEQEYVKKLWQQNNHFGKQSN